MRLKHILVLTLTVLLATNLTYGKDLKTGKSVPDFSLTDIAGKVHALKDYRGKYVVLEWVNYECPFVKKHYNSGNMQSLQKTYTGKDVVWLSINSSAPGKQGNFTPAEVQKRAQAHGASFSAYLVDEDGKVGNRYDAKTTPHVFIIDPAGDLIYKGAIDNIRSTNIEDIAKAENYVSAALDAAMAGKRIEVSNTQSYGCSVKY